MDRLPALIAAADNIRGMRRSAVWRQVLAGTLATQSEDYSFLNEPRKVVTDLKDNANTL